MGRDFNIGDEVVIRDWDDMAQEFGLQTDGSIRCHLFFVTKMKDLCGRHFTIVSVSPSGAVILDPKPGRWNISTDMIRHVNDTDIPEIDLDGFLAVLVAES